MAVERCEWCGSKMPAGRNTNGVAKRFCSDRCRLAAWAVASPTHRRWNATWHR